MSAILRPRGVPTPMQRGGKTHSAPRKMSDPEDKVLPFQWDDGTDDNEEIRQRRYSSSSSSGSDGDYRQRRGANSYRGHGLVGAARSRPHSRSRSRSSRDKESEWEKASNGHREDEDDFRSESDSDHETASRNRKALQDKPESPRRTGRKKTQQSESQSSDEEDEVDDPEEELRKEGEELRKESAASARTMTATPSSAPSTPRLLGASDLASLSKLAVFPGSETQLVQAYVRRVKTLLHSQYQFCINDQPILMAEKQPKSRTPNYYLFDMTRAASGISSKLTKKSGNYIGKVRSNFSKKKSVLIGNQSRRTELGVVIFSGNVTNSEPRRVTVVLPPLNAKRHEIDGLAVGDEPDMFSVLVEHYKALKKLDKKNHSLKHQVQVFENKQPVFENGFYRLNFHGRVSVPSVKNFQLVTSDVGRVSTSSSHETVAEDTVFLQFGKVDDNKFHLDFRAPITPIQAFAIALAQFNL